MRILVDLAVENNGAPMPAAATKYSTRRNEIAKRSSYARLQSEL